MFIFLDFYGVLRRKQSPHYRVEGDCLRSFENAVRSLPNAQIVISSSWREAFSLGEKRKMFSPDIAERIVGVTPIEWHRKNYNRYREVLAFLKRNGTQGPAGYPGRTLDEGAADRTRVRDFVASGDRKKAEPTSGGYTFRHKPLA